MKSIILAGGTGTRLYPISTAENPKQFIPLFTSETESLFQLTVKRCQQLSTDKDIYVVASWAHRELVESQLGASGIKVIYEDSARNTLPALALGLRAVVDDCGPNCTVGVFPADHLIGDGIFESLTKANEFATKGEIVLLGVTPTEPSTEYGYIWPGHTVGLGVNHVQAFVEKPALPIAKSYMQRGFLWNSGIIVADVKTLVTAIMKHAPQINSRILNASSSETVNEIYDGLTALSIDYGLLEYLRTVLVVQMDVTWTDCGSISALRRVLCSDTFI
ncbi:mannose-1-phosphate guanylyltransferase [Candidatus Pacearchaeota archaeon]|nr:mannose-1-phosphate guanylyltransferase [Candidatus Pacearchaeota archaeon]